MKERELAYRIVKLEDGNDEGDENAGSHQSVNNLLAAEQQQQHDRDSAEDVHQGRTDGCGSNRTQIGAEQALRGGAEARELPGLHAECLHDAVSSDAFVKDVLDIGQFVLSATSRMANACADFAGREDNERDK